MTRVQAAFRRAQQAAWGAAGLGAIAMLPVVSRDLAIAWIIGLLLGALNVRMLNGALRRGMRLTGGEAKAALSASSGVRLLLMMGLIVWVFSRHMATASFAPFLGGWFLPQMVFGGVLLWGRQPMETSANEEGDSA